ncbi:ATP-dependent DNA ligase [Patescibacteria group bacterium]
MLFKTFSSYLSRLEKTASRNLKTEILANLFTQTKAEEIGNVCYLCLGRLAPKFESLEFNMAEKTILKSIARAAKVDEGLVTKEYKQIGDLGNTAFKLIKNKTYKKQDVNAIYESLLKIAKEKGEGSVERKINKMADLLQNLDATSTRFVARIPVNKLRLGFSDMTILDALSWMETGDKSLRKELERAFNVLADIGKIAKAFKSKGISGIKSIKSEVGIPIRAAKAERLPNASKILEKLDGQCALEEKYDGFRVQIHFDKARKFSLKEENNLSLFAEKSKHFTRIFSRNLDNMTHMFPDVIEACQHLKCQSVILDGEAIAFNPKTKKFLPFQETVQRKRKHGILKKSQEIPLKILVFDVLYKDGKGLLSKPFYQRRRVLEKLLLQSKGEEKGLLLTKQKIVTKPEEFDQFFNTTVKDGLEGLMAKKLDSVYQAGARNYNWVKYKAAMQSELADTIDCIVMGYYQGKGKRTGFGIGAFLVGIYDKNKILTISKIGTGLTDKQWQEMFARCQQVKTANMPKEYQVAKSLKPDVWCQPKLVVEIEADTITKSPIHTAKLALRFPRLKKFRDDKDIDQATTLSEMKKLVTLKV